MNIQEINYEQEISIDDSALDVEWLQQASLTLKYCQLEARAEQALERAKENLDIVSAELDKKIREDPDGYELQKNTEGEIRNTIQRHPDYQEAQDKVSEAKYNLNYAKAAVRAIYAKKEALENLVRLHGQQYFAGPKVPRNLNQEWAKKQKQASSNKNVKIGQKTKRKPKRTRK